MCASVSRFGAEPYCPLVFSRKLKPTPLFTSYVFVHDNDEMDRPRLQYLWGVSDFVRRSSHYARVGDDVVTALQAQEVDGVIPLVEAKVGVVYHQGDEVTVILPEKAGSPELSMVAKFMRYKGRDRAMVLLKILDSEREVVVDLHHIRKALAA